MKKVLIIADLFHASPRIPGIATYLPEFGWEATIITPSIGSDVENRFGFPEKFLERAKIIDAPYRGDIFWFWRKIFKLFGFKTSESITEQVKEHAGITLKRSFIDILMNWYQIIFAYPDTEKTWRKPALKAGGKILKKEHFDVIISSSSPVTTHIIANKLKSKYKIPWLADLRDLWTQNPYYTYCSIRKIFEEKLELKTLLLASALVTVSQPLAEKLRKLHKKKRIYTITNGFDPEKVNISLVKLTSKFTITYTGRIYTRRQDPLKLLAALKNLISKRNIEPKNIEVRFYGPRQIWLDKEIERYGLSAIAKQYGVVPRVISYEKQRESQILLLLNWEDAQEKGCYTGKIFEYLAAQRPVLAIGGLGNDVVAELIEETKAGVYKSSIKEIETAVKNCYEEYKHTGKVSYMGGLEKINKYSYREMARKFASLLNTIG